jgi:hypothetical protein
VSHPLESIWPLVIQRFDHACELSKASSRRETVTELNQVARRLTNYQTQADWVDAILDGAAAFAEHVALFFVESGAALHLRGRRGLDLPDDLSFEAVKAPAFADAIGSKEAVIALRIPEEVSGVLAVLSPTRPHNAEGSLFPQSDGKVARGTSTSVENAVEPPVSVAEPAVESEYLPVETPQRCYLVPLLNRTRVVAVLFAAGDQTDLNAIELIATIASAVLEQHGKRPDLVAVESGADHAPAAAVKPKTLPAWADLADAERNLHIRAQRFARVRVAEMQLYKADLCQKGIERKDLYLYLKPEIEPARESYRAQFMTIPSMVDYLHLELVASLAHGDEFLLGVEYPGQML